MIKEVEFETSKKLEVLDLTNELKGLELEGDGLLLIFTPHATAALILNEAENGLMKDFEKWVGENFKGDWEHDKIDNNASSHLASGLLSPSVLLPVKKGRVIRGTWQNLLFFELDGPRSTRRILFQFINY